MPLQIHHLNKSQSERILWLCEALSVPYELIRYQRNAENILAPPELKALHPAQTAPVMVDETPDGSKVVLAESGAIVEYIIHVHGNGKLAVKPGDKDFAEYVNWLHIANGTFQAAVSRLMIVRRLLGDKAEGHPSTEFVQNKLNGVLKQMEERLKKTNAYLGGNEVSAADIMNVFSLTTMRGFCPYDLSDYPAILNYLERVGNRQDYQRAMQKGDPDLKPMLGAHAEPFKFGPPPKARL